MAWDMGYYDTLFGYDWELTKSQAGAWRWTPADGEAANAVHAHDPTLRHALVIATIDVPLIKGPAYLTISKRFHTPEALADAFARVWFKLTHRDMVPPARDLGSMVPGEVLVWQEMNLDRFDIKG